MKTLILLVLILFALGCEKDTPQRPTEFEIIVPDSRFDLVFPKELWSEVLNGAPMSINTSESVYEFFETLPVQAEVAEAKGNAFGGTNYRFDFKEFGGLIDFDAYLDRSSSGSFRLFFNLPNIANLSNLKVYFLSWSEQYTRSGDVFGNGCGYFYDISSYFKKTMFTDGLLLHTKDYRYLDLAAGRLYFVNYTDKKIEVAQVTLTDRKLEERLCSDRI